MQSVTKLRQKSEELMTSPKRHHWWPQLQSGHWTNSEGFINVTRADGTTFLAPPTKIGVERDLYTRYEFADQKDLTIEHWFSREIETPFADALNRLVPLDDIIVVPNRMNWPERAKDIRDLGFVAQSKVEALILTPEHRTAIDRYLAALLVRNPRYLAKLARFHDEHGTRLSPLIPRDDAIRTVSLDSMLEVFEIYRKKIANCDLGILIVEGDHELLFADCGVSVDEPWRSGPLPFDMHAPITPKIANSVVPSPLWDPTHCFVSRCRNRGTALMNRIMLRNAERFVFSRQKPPVKFIKDNIGKHLPGFLRYELVDGKWKIEYDRSVKL